MKLNFLINSPWLIFINRGGIVEGSLGGVRIIFRYSDKIAIPHLPPLSISFKGDYRSSQIAKSRGDTGHELVHTATPTTSPTETPSGSTSNCYIAGTPVQFGTAFVNVLIPLVPAFAVGYRYIRRKNQGVNKK